MSSELVNYKLNVPLKMKVLAMMARGEKYATISRILKDDHGVEYSSSALSQLRKNNADTLSEMEAMIFDAEAAESEQIRAKAMRQINRKLDRANQDDQELAHLDAEYREGKIDMGEYRRRKAGLLKLSVAELLMVTKEMSAQGQGRKVASTPGAHAISDGQTPQTADPQYVEALMLAIQRGDTIAMQQLTITPA